MLGCCQLEPQEQIQWNFNQNTNRIIHENASENIVWEMADIYSRENELKLCCSVHRVLQHRLYLLNVEQYWYFWVVI